MRKTRPDKVPALFRIQKNPSRPARAQHQWERRCVQASTPTGTDAGKARGRGIPRQRRLIAAGRWRCFVNGCGVESTLGLALSRAGVGAAAVIRNLVGAKADPLSQSAYLSPREIPIRESHFVSPPRVNVAQKRRLRKIGGKVAAAGCCMYVGKDPQGQSAEHQWFGDCTFCVFVGGSLPAHVRYR